eukprot:TRINITY_DN14859_c0_g1_i4.p1 TRINITY_DN14859_c0_g1~~TRINITY_DN14859_c0_g1_i4.p1  ORF type:complete len:183 (+),score=35.32 TRINITY_DN14859_c0_g1_i4:243-791(+)
MGICQSFGEDMDNQARDELAAERAARTPPGSPRSSKSPKPRAVEAPACVGSPPSPAAEAERPAPPEQLVQDDGAERFGSGLGDEDGPLEDEEKIIERPVGLVFLELLNQRLSPEGFVPKKAGSHHLQEIMMHWKDTPEAAEWSENLLQEALKLVAVPCSLIDTEKPEPVSYTHLTLPTKRIV